MKEKRVLSFREGSSSGRAMDYRFQGPQLKAFEEHDTFFIFFFSAYKSTGWLALDLG